MWKDLTLKEKAEIMKMSVANGVTDINDIQQLYDDSVGHRFDDAGRIITLADLPREYVQKYGHINVVTPKGVRMPLSQAYSDYNQTPVNVNDVPGLTDYLIKQDQPDISEQAHIDKVAADREIRQRNNIINSPIFDKEKIYNRVPGDMWQAVISDENNQSVGANRGIARSLFGYYFNPDNAVESRLRRYEKYKDLSMEEVMNAGIEFDRMWEKYGLDSIRNSPVLSKKMTELESKMRAPYVLQHEDAKDLYLGLPQRNNTIKDAEYNPTNGTLRNGKYVSYMRDPAFINDVIMPSYNHLKRNFIDKERIKRGLYKDHSYNMNISLVKEITPRGYARVEFPFLNNATLSGGIDSQRGEYASIFDTWDYNTNIMGTPGDNVGKYIEGEPFDIYDRYYLDDYYGISSKPQDNGYYGGYLPEILITNKKALGGHLYDKAGPLNKAKQQPKYQYGIIEQILRENGVNFRVTSGKRKPNQAGNAGKGSAHTYTIFGNSPGAIDIVPGVGSDWNTLFAQMNSPKVRRALAAYGLDVLNETNPSVMASTKATGPHLHVGRGIKGQSGTGQMFGGTSFGGGKGSYTMPQYSTAGSGSYASMMQQQAMEPITLAGSNATSPWLNYISKIGQQRPVSFNTPIGTPSITSGSIITEPISFNLPSYASSTRPEVMENVAQLPQYQSILNSNLFTDPYLLFRNS